jgi:hypothetical protein
MSRVQSSIGASQHYGPRVSNEGLPASVTTYGPTRIVEVPFDWVQANAGLPVVDADEDAAVLSIPANSLVKAAYLHVTTAFTSGGSATLELGLEDEDGSASDADGLDSLAVAALTANSWHVLDGALIGATSGVENAQISIDDATAAFTAGKARLIVEYILPVTPNA